MKIKSMVMVTLTALAALVLVACGGKSSSSGSNSTSSSAPTLKTARVKTGTLTAYVPAGKNTDWLKNALTLYNKKYGTSLTLKTTDVAPAVPMVQKITPMLVAKQTMPDLIMLQDSNAGSILAKFQDSFYASQDFGFIGQYGKDFYPAKMSYAKTIAPNKKVYGFPNDWGTSMMFYNATLFKQAGVDMSQVKTWDDLIAAGKTLKAQTGKNLLYMRDTGELDTVKNIAMELGATLIDKDGNVDITNAKVLEAYAILKKIQDADIVSYGNTADYLKIGQESGMIQAGGWFAAMQQTTYTSGKGDWRIAPLPLVNASDKPVSPMSGGSSWYVAKKAKNPVAAMQFISFVLTNKDSLDEYLKLTGLPANTTAYTSTLANQTFDYYGGQKILQEMNTITKASITGYAFPYTADLDTYLAAASYEIQKNGTAPKTALADQAAKFAAKYSIKVVQ
ncbi:ABC transporter substrate-binding protein [Lacticaseibacillus daqingensis]|uniref:ABC transporter substrate-binding protein n=1 Tax=Lacticaseibacillus daqingensis TaxID=2486014 RepID=UPI000F77B90F|nr:extracellular solute-binding protein [Lacticaseibacillus daqingensis]